MKMEIKQRKGKFDCGVNKFIDEFSQAVKDYIDKENGDDDINIKLVYLAARGAYWPFREAYERFGEYEHERVESLRTGFRTILQHLPNSSEFYMPIEHISNRIEEMIKTNHVM